MPERVAFYLSNKIILTHLKTVRKDTCITVFTISVLWIQILKDVSLHNEEEDLCRLQKPSVVVWEPGELPELQILFLFYNWIQGQSLETILVSPNMKLTFGDDSGERIKSLGVHSLKKQHSISIWMGNFWALGIVYTCVLGLSEGTL